MMMISDPELVPNDSMAELFGQMEIREPLPPEEIVGKQGEQIFLFFTPEYGFHNAYKSPFTMLGRNFATAEQYLAWQKARFFGDFEVAEQIMCVSNMQRIRRLAQRVRNFRPEEWKTFRDQIMYNGLRAKFTQNPLLFEQLIATGDGIIAESSISNPHWSNGVSPSNLRRLRDPQNWAGDNALGNMLMELREELCNCIF